MASPEKTFTIGDGKSLTGHEWEQIDHGEAVCIVCEVSTAWPFPAVCMNRQTKQDPKPEPKPVQSDTVRRGNEQEIENLKRLLADVTRRLDSLKTR